MTIFEKIANRVTESSDNSKAFQAMLVDRYMHLLQHDQVSDRDHVAISETIEAIRLEKFLEVVFPTEIYGDDIGNAGAFLRPIDSEEFDALPVEHRDTESLSNLRSAKDSSGASADIDEDVISESIIDPYHGEDLDSFSFDLEYTSEKSSVAEPKSRQTWSIYFSDNFRKTVLKLPKNLQGRILTILTTIVENPMKIIGNTNKPLSGDMNGLWRCRIGAFRLIYDPHVEEKVIVLLSIGARGGAYK